MSDPNDDKNFQMFTDKYGVLRVTFGGKDMFLTPSSASQARAEALLPTEGSEDAAHLLGEVPVARNRDDGDNGEYLPNESVSWVLTVSFPGDPVLNPREIESRFDAKWRKRFGSFMSYGRDAASGLWTYLTSADGPTAVTQLKFEWRYARLYDDEPVTIAGDYEKRIAGIRQQLASIGEAKIEASASPAEAARRSEELEQVKRELDRSIILVLRAAPNAPFEGRAVWDVMLCLGLRWGDMDYFHWMDADHDSLFSVWTSTEPGYFFPEEIASGNVLVEDLCFQYSVPRCPAPSRVFDAMWAAAQYCQKRLGGTLTIMNEECVEPAEVRSEIETIVRKLNDAGFQPGANATLQMF